MEGIRAGRAEALEELYRLFRGRTRFYLARHVRPGLIDDKLHDTFLLVVGAIQRGELREPEALMAFVRTIAQRQVIEHIHESVKARRGVDASPLYLVDRRRNPEQHAIARQSTRIARACIERMKTRDREVLTRFYLQDEAIEGICREMQLSATQFRLLKSRAKQRFEALGRKAMAA